MGYNHGVGAHLLVDGDCPFCMRCAAFARRVVQTSAVVVPWQSVDVVALGVTPEACDEAVQWISADGTVVSGADAVIAALLAGRQPWRFLGALAATLPNSFVEGAYRRVARRRSCVV